MTVSYQYDVASSASGGFIRLLFRWRGSVWKVVYRDMLIFLVSYVLLTLLYRFALTDSQQRIFEKVVYFCSTFMDLIPLSFMLGFYVSFIAARWWSQFIAIPWPDKLMNIVAMYIPGLDEASRVVRRTLMRYLNLSLVLVLRSISMAVKRRFPTKDHLVEAGFMTKTELEMFQSVPSTEFNTFWIPCTWFINVLREARQECRITDSNGLKLIMEELNEFRSKCGLLWGYDWISIPLVYTQVVTMATYAFYVACMFGRQNVKTEENEELRGHRYDYFVPIFTILQLMFYMGLLKVAEQLINPFGDDDEDFELNWIIDRHMKVSYLGVDTLNGPPPPLVKDTYYNELDVKIPYTEASRTYKKKTYRGSVAYMQVPMEQQSMVLPELMEESEDDGETISESMGQRRGSVYTLFHSKGAKGISPSGSFGNLDNASLDSDWRGSFFNLDRKNSAGTLGRSQESALHVDMSKAEEDEIVLQEVVVDPKPPKARPALVSRSDSLQIPGMTVTPPQQQQQEKCTSLLCVRREASPKIAPKFPREKLKSMFRKRKLSTTLPFYKIKGVRFSKDTKDEDKSSEDEANSLLTRKMLPDDEVDVEITISNPELSEIEKQLGVHPYQALQAITPEELSKGLTKLSVKSAEKKLGGSHNVLGPRDMDERTTMMMPEVHKCTSLPNIQEASLTIARIALVPNLGKIAVAKKTKTKKPKKKRRSPPPPPERFSDPDTLSEENNGQTGEDGRRNTLPQIMLTRSGHLTPENLDLATSSGKSSTSDHSNDSYQVPPPVPKRVSLPRTTTTSEKAPSKDTSAERISKGQLPPASSSSAKQKSVKVSQTPASKIHSTQATPKQTQPTKSFKGPTRTHSLPAAPKPKIHVRNISPAKPRQPEQKPPLPEKPRRTQQPVSSIKMPSVSSSSPPPGGPGPTSPVRSIISPSVSTRVTVPSLPRTSSKPPRPQQQVVQISVTEDPQAGTRRSSDVARSVTVPQTELESDGRSRVPPDRSDQSRTEDHSSSNNNNSKLIRKDKSQK